MLNKAFAINEENPWPWLEPFPEYAASFFNGRDRDGEVLLDCVLSSPVTVLFGKSGLGKSSLLQAGLFPRLRSERLLPIYVRLSHEQDSSCASEQIARRIQEELQKNKQICESLVSDPTKRSIHYEDHQDIGFTNSLWIKLHLSDLELRDDSGQRWFLVFVLDQFEEIFTLAAENPERQKQLFYELGDLMENRIPKGVSQQLNTDDELFERLNLDGQHYRFMLSLREDYLPDLEEWIDLFPRLGSNRYRLLPMSSPQAVDAIEKTGRSLVKHEDAENIVNYLAKSFKHSRHGQAQIEPTLLSLMCSGLNKERIEGNKPHLDTTYLASRGVLIVEKFYDNAFEELPESVRDFVEQHLITEDGLRLPYPERSVQSEDPAVAEHIKTLINRRIIRRESLEGVDRIELVHDYLAQVAFQRRQESRRRKETQRKRQLRRRWRIGVTIVIILLLMISVFLVDANLKAKRALLDATAMRLIVVGGSITSGLHQDRQIRGLFKILAGHRLARSTNTDEALQNEYLRFSRLIYMYENQTSITSIAFSPDGNRIVFGSEDKMLRFWDVKTGKLVGQPIKAYEKMVTSVAFSPDGARVVSAGEEDDGTRIVSAGEEEKALPTLRLWDAKTGLPIGPLMKGHKNQITSVAFSPDGTRIVSSSLDKTIRLWDAANGAPIEQPLMKHDGVVFCAAFSPDGSRIVSGGGDKMVRVWDAKNGHSIGRPMKGHENSVKSIAISPDGTRIVSGGLDNDLRLWDAKSGQLLLPPFKGHKELVLSVAFSPDGNRIVSGSKDKTILLWDAKTGQLIGEPLNGHSSQVNSVGFSPNGMLIGSASNDNTLRLWHGNSDQAFGFEFKGHESAVYSLAFTPDGSRIVSGSDDNTLRIWDAKTGNPIGPPLKGHDSSVISIALSPDGTRIVSGGKDKTLRLWNAETGSPIGLPLKGHGSPVLSVAFSPDGKRIVSGSGDIFPGTDKAFSSSSDNTLRLWNGMTGQPIGSPLKAHEDSVTSVAFSPDGLHIVSGSKDKTLRLWDANTGKPIGEPLKGHKDIVTSVAYSPDGSLIVSSSGDSTLRLWNAKTGLPSGSPFKAHKGSVSSVAFSRDGTHIASGGGCLVGFIPCTGDNTLRLWDVKNGQPIGLPLKGHKGAIYNVAFSPDGTRIASASEDLNLRLWDVFEC